MDAAIRGDVLDAVIARIGHIQRAIRGNLHPARGLELARLRAGCANHLDWLRVGSVSPA